MADIKSLLNPIPEKGALPQTPPTPPLSSFSRELSPPLTPRKKPKLSKDAAVFIKGNIRGPLNYPPYEQRDDFLLAQHQQHEIYPIEDIASFPRHIPYNSEKKSFMEKTGRESFEVFQYEFSVPGHEKPFVMMWDYNIGLVRTTPLFRCNGYSKTTPAKMLNRNPGLREICHSITGGALVAQGYWMPFEAARAVASTFCWRIRYALTPVFGPDFPSICVPLDSDKFGEMTVDREIITHCTKKAQEYRRLESGLTSRPSSGMSTPLTPDSPNFPRLQKRLKSQALKLSLPQSGYGTDSSVDTNYPLSAESGSHGGWTPANIPRSVQTFPSQPSLLSPQPTSAPLMAEKGQLSLEAAGGANSTSLERTAGSRSSSNDDDYDGDNSESSISSRDLQLRRQKRKASKTLLKSPSISSEEKVALLLMSLKMTKSNIETEVESGSTETGHRGRKRRASA